MRDLKKCILTIFPLLLLVTSCNTYQTYYSETVTALATSDYEEVIRLDLSVSKEMLTAEQVVQFKKLRVLNLSTKTMSELNLFLEHLPHPENLQVLILDSLGLKQLPVSIKRFSGLRHLSLNHNHHLDFKQIIEVIKELPIVFLNVQHTHLEEIPAEINRLSQLVDLNLSHNKLAGFTRYDYLASLEQLNGLWLTGNALEELPSSLGDLEQLRNLYIEYNNLVNVPEALLGMEQVWVIHAGHNYFTELPENFGKMPGLILLHINNNKISTIPDFYIEKGNYNIMGLILDANQLSMEAKILWKKIFDHFFLLSI